jgi:gliding motility-associated-like protein
MRRKALLFIILLFTIKSWSQNPATIFTIPNRNVTLPCGTTCTQITAVVPNIKQTTDYVFTGTPYLPFDYITPGGIDVTQPPYITSTSKDDQWSNKIPITFPFCFYNVTYPTLLIGTNGGITFDTSRAGQGSGYVIAVGGTIPSNAYAYPMIFGPWGDIDISNQPIPTSKIEFRVEGTAPTRRFIAAYNDVPYFSCGNSILARFSMVLYESTGIVEVYVKRKPVCATWNNGLAIIGVQNSPTQGVAAPGFNATVFGASADMDTAFRFTPSGGVSRFKSAQLLVNGVVVGTGDTSSIAGTPEKMNLTFNNVCPNADSTAYVLKLTYGRCNDVTQDVSFYDTVRVKKLTPTFTLSSINSNCSGGGSITASVTGGTGTFQYALNGGNFQPGNVFSNLTAGTYVVTTQNPVSNCSFSQSVVLSLNNNLTINALPSDTSVCVGASFTPRVTSAGTSYVWNGPGTFSSATAAQPVITPKTSGMFIVSATQGPCTRRDTINVTQLPAPLINAGPDIVMINGDVVQIAATAGPGTYLWNPPTGLSSPTVLQPNASPSQTTDYTLTATSTQGCVSQDVVKVTVLNCVEPMDAFTPNGDGVNDKWLVNLRACYTKALVEVFNRYGNRVFRSENYQNDWDGRWEGKALPDGTYYYVITLELINGKKTYVKGNVTILR